LSKTTVVILKIFWRLSAFLIKIPCSAHFPTQTIIAVGVANQRAQGQAMTKTLTKATIQNTKFPKIIHTIRLKKAIIRTIETKTAEI
jgi:hypothetical protein